MTFRRARRLSLGVEIALALFAGAASFALVAVIVAAAGSDVVAIFVAVGYVAGVAAMFRFLGVAYAVPAAVSGLIAYDWYYLPPTHPREFPDGASLVDLGLYLAVSVLIGQLAERARRRADVSESARSELAEEQAALRRVATLVARGEAPDAVFAAVAAEVAGVLNVDGARVIRYVSPDEALQLEGWTAPGHEPLPMGTMKLESTTLGSEVLRTGRPARIEDYSSVNRAAVQRFRIKSGAAAPIVVDGRMWGAMLAWSVQPRSLPDDAEVRLAAFTELIATAVSNSASREELARLAEEQAALRRVATLVASGVPPRQVFAAVAQEVGLLLRVNATHIGRYEPDGTVTAVGSWGRDGTHVPAGTRNPLDDATVAGQVFRTGRPARMDDYGDTSDLAAAMARDLGILSTVGAPVVVDGHLWGVMLASSNDPQPLATDTEARIAAFTELVATAISNTEARAELRRVAEEQAALRRVATLVARERPPTEVFAKVAEEVGLLLGADGAAMANFEPDGTATVVAIWGEVATASPVGTRMTLEGDGIAARVLRTGRPARIDELGVRSAVGGPIVVDGRLWGAVAASRQTKALPAGTELRIGEFTELAATAISNIQARSELAASRARIVAAADEERRRVVRDLHDGAQQRLVHTVVTLKLVRRALENEGERAPALVTEALQHAEEATAELRELAHGILPAVLTRGGLRAGVDALASRMPVPVENDVTVDRLPAEVEATAYFLVAETLTNVAKHSHAHRAAVTARIERRTLQVQVRDDGVGGAQAYGSGLLGLSDRLAVLDGSLRVESPPDGGTLVAAAIPLP